jgi:hypothetical protein
MGEIMNQRQQQAVINDNLREHFSIANKRHIDAIVFNIGNTIEHEMKKCEIAYNLLKDGNHFICEGIMRSGLRPDITVLDVSNPICYEIMHSEKKISDKKRLLYPGIIVEVRV